MAQILAFGDSITDGAYDEQGGWAARMQRHFMSANLQKDVINDETDWFYNLGISGNTARDMLARIDTEAKARKIFREDKRSVILFAIGTNDSAADMSSHNYRFSEDEFRLNLLKLESKVRSGQTKVIFIGPMPVIESFTTPIYGDCWYTNERIGRFNDVIRELAHGLPAVFIDLLQDASQIDENYFMDGLHPNTRGHEWMYDKIMPIVKETLKTL